MTGRASLSMQQLVTLSEQAGFRGQAAATAAAIAMAESSGNPTSAGDVGLGGSGATSFGPWQIHIPAHPEYTAAQLYDPATSAAAAYKISSSGTNFGPWSTYTSGAYRQYMPAALKAVGTAGSGITSSLTAAVTGVPPASSNPTSSSIGSDLLYALLFAGAIVTGAIVLGLGVNRAASSPARTAKTAAKAAA